MTHDWEKCFQCLNVNEACSGAEEMFVYTLNIQAVPGTRENGGMGGGRERTYVYKKKDRWRDGWKYVWIDWRIRKLLLYYYTPWTLIT